MIQRVLPLLGMAVCAGGALNEALDGRVGLQVALLVGFAVWFLGWLIETNCIHMPDDYREEGES